MLKALGELFKHPGQETSTVKLFWAPFSVLGLRFKAQDLGSRAKPPPSKMKIE